MAASQAARLNSGARGVRRSVAARAHGTKLAAARRGGGSGAVGWVLLGFVLGVAAAIIAMLHADITRVPAMAVLAAPSRVSAPRLAGGPVAPAPPKALTAARAPVLHTLKPTVPHDEVEQDAASTGMTARTETDRAEDLY